MSGLGPFATGTRDGQEYGKVTAQARIDMVRHFNTRQCREALQVQGLQSTVKAAIERRQRRIAREGIS